MSYRLGWVGKRSVRGLGSACAVGAAGVAAFCGVLLSTTAAEARTITVDLFGERPSGLSGQCTLREAVQAVNLQAGIQGCPAPDGQPDTILLLPGTYTVRLAAASDTLSINREASVDGNGFEATTVTASNQVGGVPLFTSNASSGGVTFRGLTLTTANKNLALRVRAGTTASVYNSHIKLAGNEVAGFATSGCLLNEGSLYMSSVEISQCRGWGAGAIANTGWLYLDSTSVVDTSHAARNGAIANQGASAQLFVYNSTIANNRGSNHATALNNSGGATAELYSSTVVDNISDGLATLPAINNSSGTVKIQSTLIGRNTTSQCAGTITSLGYNYLGESFATCAPTATQATDKSGGGSIGLSSLRRVGGVTRVKVPTAAAGNPILNHIPQAQCAFTDQRGLKRLDFGANCDIGAVDRGHATIVVGDATTVPVHDTTMKQWLNDAGLDTVFVDDNSPAPNLAVSGRSVAIISTSVDDATVGTKYKSAAIGTVVNKVSALDNMAMVNTNDFGVFNSPAESVAVPFNGTYFHHKIGNFPSLLNNGGGGWGNPATSSAVWLVYYMFNTKPCVFRINKGIAAASGFVLPAGRISFPGWTSLFSGSGTPDGKEVFYEAVLWASVNK